MTREDYHREIIHAKEVLTALVPTYRMREAGLPDQAVTLTHQAYDKLCRALRLIEQGEAD
jgi:hypothetical protein